MVDQPGKQLSVRIILNPENSGWILEKIARRLAENLTNWNVKSDIADKPSEKVDINHWILYLHYQGNPSLHSTMLITHVDRPGKLFKIKDCMKTVDIGICLSRMTQEYLIQHGVEKGKLCYITPAHDGVVNPKRIVIGITTRLYSDGRKRQDILVKLARTMKLDGFHFKIYGQGWEEVIPMLLSSGATVEYSPGGANYLDDYQEIIQSIPKFDYYLYMGMDEGSMGFLDALAAGVKTIVTPQGFHLDVAGGITHPFETVEQLGSIFEEISKEKQSLIDSVRYLTWNEYARQHAVVWRAVLEKNENISELMHGNIPTGAPYIVPPYWKRVWMDTQFYGKPIVKRLQRYFKNK